MITLADLQKIPIFSDLPHPDLEWLQQHMEEVIVEKGQILRKDGDPAMHMSIILEGAMEARRQGGGASVAFPIGEGDLGGVIPFSRMQHYPGNVVALRKTRLAVFPKSCFRDMLVQIPDLGSKFAWSLIDRSRDALIMQQQQEKLMSLGKLSAGLAHELNNPAAAVRSTVQELAKRFEEFPAVVVGVIKHNLSKSEIEYFKDFKADSSPKTPLTALERSEKEDEISDWLMDHQVTEGYIWAEIFVHAGVTVQKLEDLQDYLNEAALPAVLRWLAFKFQTDQMLSEISSASDRISSLIDSIKSYTHMDQAKDRSRVDILQGIEGTLTMLGHKFKGKNVSIVRNYEAELPEVTGLAGELNQVWTNLIANAIDAMPKQGGILTLEVAAQGNCLRVSVIDNGSGILATNLPYIFDPFFTTKGVNEGTGLGLDIVRSIVVRSHMGKIQAISDPGRTEFRVTLPSTNAGEEGNC